MIKSNGYNKNTGSKFVVIEIQNLNMKTLMQAYHWARGNFDGRKIWFKGVTHSNLIVLMPFLRWAFSHLCYGHVLLVVFSLQFICFVTIRTCVNVFIWQLPARWPLTRSLIGTSVLSPSFAGRHLHLVMIQFFSLCSWYRKLAVFYFYDRHQNNSESEFN